MSKTSVTAKAKIYPPQIQDLRLGVEPESIPSLDYLSKPRERNGLIIIEGCSGVGKTTLAEYLELMINFPIYEQIGFHTELKNVWSEHVAISQLYNTNLRIIQDRSLISWCYYHRDFVPVLSWWAQNLQRWDFSVVICLFSSPSLVMEKIRNKKEGYDNHYTEESIRSEMDVFKELCGYISDDVLIKYEIVDSTNSWLWHIYEEILERMQRTDV